MPGPNRIIPGHGQKLEDRMIMLFFQSLWGKVNYRKKMIRQLIGKFLYPYLFYNSVGCHIWSRNLLRIRSAQDSALPMQQPSSTKSQKAPRRLLCRKEWRCKAWKTGKPGTPSDFLEVIKHIYIYIYLYPYLYLYLYMYM